MPMGIDDRETLPDFCRHQLQLVFGQAADVNLDMQHVVFGELRDDSAGQDIQILESLDDASDGAGISVRYHAKPPQG